MSNKPRIARVDAARMIQNNFRTKLIVRFEKNFIIDFIIESKKIWLMLRFKPPRYQFNHQILKGRHH